MHNQYILLVVVSEYAYPLMLLLKLLGQTSVLLDLLLRLTCFQCTSFFLLSLLPLLPSELLLVVMQLSARLFQRGLDILTLGKGVSVRHNG